MTADQARELLGELPGQHDLDQAIHGRKLREVLLLVGVFYGLEGLELQRWCACTTLSRAWRFAKLWQHQAGRVELVQALRSVLWDDGFRPVEYQGKVHPPLWPRFEPYNTPLLIGGGPAEPVRRRPAN